MSNKIAIIPLRAGSKGIPNKNKKRMLGRPLYQWALSEAIFSNLDKVYIFTDDQQIIEDIKGEYYWTDKVEVVERSEESAVDTASTEMGMLELATYLNYDFDIYCLIQATSPLLTREDINRVLSKIEEEQFDSALTVVENKRFTWTKEGRSVNYDYLHRPRRQDYEGMLVENGAFYAVRKETYLQEKNRLGGKIGIVKMCEDSLYEIDEPSDWDIIEILLKNRELKRKKNRSEIKYLVLDVDGVFTEGKVAVTKEVTSTMYPIMEWRAKDYGKAYDNYGFSINSPFLNEFNKVLAKATKKYPYSFSIYTRPNEKSSGTVFRSLYGENEVEVLLSSAPVIDPSLEQRRDLLNVFKSEYYNEKDPIEPYKLFAFLDPYIYDKNIDLVLKKFLETEKEAISFEPSLYPADNAYAKNIDWYDFTGLNKEDLEDQFGLINPFTCKTSKNVKLQTVRLSEERPKLRDNLKEVNMSVNKPIFLQGGSDGTLDDAHFEEAIKLELAKYADPDSELQELAYAIESCIWDSGFSLDVKKELINIISIRKDTMVCLGTHTVDGSNPLPTSKARAVATALEARLKLNPESTYYGTSVARGIIVLGAGELSTEETGITYPLTYDLMVKTARFAGAGNGKWKREYLFDHGENAVIRTMKNIVPEFIPTTMRPVLWNANTIYPQRYDRENYFFPALQTVFANDTSVLNNYFTILALCDVTKVGFDVWKNFTGVISLTESEFKEQVESYATQLLSGKYARIINVTPECRITDADKARGYSYQLIFKLSANNMKTVCIYTTEVYRAGEELK